MNCFYKKRYTGLRMKNPVLFWLIVAMLGATAAKGQNAADFYFTDSLQTIKITFEQDNWRYLLDSLRFNGDDLLLGRVEVNDRTFRDVGVRYRDRRSFKPGQARNGLYIDLDFINKGQEYSGHRAINLSSALRDPSLLREVLGYEIARQYMPAPRANFARVLVNGDYYGLFVNVEPIDDHFLERQFGATEGSLFFSDPRSDEPEPAGCKSGVDGSLQYDNQAQCYLRNFVMYSQSGWDELIELTRLLEKAPERLSILLDIDRTLWMHAFNNLTVNLSSYAGQYSPNYYLYQQSNGRFVPVLWDLNLAFGSFKNTGQGSDLAVDELVRLDPLLHADNPMKPLISQLLAQDRYRKIYLAHLRTLIEEQFADGRFERRAKELQRLIREAVAEDENQAYELAGFDRSLEQIIGERSRIPGLVDFMNRRVDYLKRQEALTVVPPRVSDIELQERPRFSSERITDFKVRARVSKYTTRVHLFYRFGDSGAYRQKRMHDDGDHGDMEAGDGIFGVRVTPEGSARRMQYYIVAENAGAVYFQPPQYMNTPLEADLDALNE